MSTLSKILVGVILLSGFSTAVAQTNARVEAEASIKLDRSSPKSLMQKILPSREARGSSTSTQVRANTTVRLTLKGSLEKMIARMEATIERESSILARIDSRIDKVKLAGGNTADSELYATEAREHLAEARASLQSLRANVSEIASLDASGDATRASLLEGMMKVRSSAQETEKHIRSAHRTMIEAVSILKGVSSTTRVEARVNASSTNSQN